MKRITLFFLFIIGVMIVISGCGGGSKVQEPPTETTLIGQVHTQDGQSLENVSITIGNYRAVTDSSGNFQIENFMTGSYQVSVRGISDDDLYLYGPATIAVSKDGVLDITAYKLNGFGVIAAPFSSDEGSVASLAFNNDNDSFKRISWDDFERRDEPNYANTTTMSLENDFSGSTAAVSDDFLNHNTSYFALKWEAVDGAEKYQIKYKNELIWDSAIDPNDKEPYSADDPQAYLDLSDELSGETITAGDHDFQLLYIKSNNENIVASISLSIGQYLSNYPTELARTEGQNQITWQGVDEAHNYRVKIYADNKFANEQWSSDLINADNSSTYSVPFDGSSLNDTVDDHYHFTVDAIYYDEDGLPLELTRNNSGFRYE